MNFIRSTSPTRVTLPDGSGCSGWVNQLAFQTGGFRFTGGRGDAHHSRWNGTHRSHGDAVSHGGTLDAVDNTDGSLDALYLLQLIYDMAPDAQVVMASPGVSSVPGEMATIVAALATGDSDAGIPAADIIIDDLFTPIKILFEIDEVSVRRSLLPDRQECCI